jgi:hypothetical protein
MKLAYLSDTAAKCCGQETSCVSVQCMRYSCAIVEIIGPSTGVASRCHCCL